MLSVAGEKHTPKTRDWIIVTASCRPSCDLSWGKRVWPSCLWSMFICVVVVAVYIPWGLWIVVTASWTNMLMENLNIPGRTDPTIQPNVVPVSGTFKESKRSPYNDDHHLYGDYAATGIAMRCPTCFIMTILFFIFSISEVQLLPRGPHGFSCLMRLFGRKPVRSNNDGIFSLPQECNKREVDPLDSGKPPRVLSDICQLRLKSGGDTSGDEAVATMMGLIKLKHENGKGLPGPAGE
ncbi:hypothetical protein DEU56DRAFT_947249 [Suillus clintonianus]|uniref:uncharacterized protein n=1 Tax=Suillus clintonianus TaxID=1904413 RepID=UPI001B877196|nr:uncharacterized protein DEU56DRAFT_947249 [Suillus clintonianus]KAG2136010.1 hypothetical protein DEU56DRAFT_947249 [Suillus clintonianus]